MCFLASEERVASIALNQTDELRAAESKHCTDLRKAEVGVKMHLPLLFFSVAQCAKCIRIILC